MTKLLGTLAMIVGAIQGGSEIWGPHVPPNYHFLVHILLWLSGVVVWAVQTNYGPGGQLTAKPDLNAGQFTQAVAKFRGDSKP